MIYKGKVLQGTKEGRAIGFPTINLSPTLIPETTRPGVYTAKVLYNEKWYLGALYFGPRLVKKEKHNVLEIYILDFDESIYDAQIHFTLETHIRGVMNFNSLEDLKAQIKSDIHQIRQTSTL